MTVTQPRPVLPTKPLMRRIHSSQLTVLTPHTLSGGSYRPVTLMVMGEAEQSQVSGSGGVQVIDRPRRVAATQWFDRSPFMLTLNFIMDATITSSTPISDFAELERWLEAPTTSGTIIQPPYLSISGPTPGTSRHWMLSTLTEKTRLYTPSRGELSVTGVAVLYEFQPPYPYKSTSPAKNQRQTTTSKTSKTYTIKAHDTILKIAALKMGKASAENGMDILNMNRNVLGNAKMTVNLTNFVGKVIRIPSS
jgi:hypothetical protein